MSNHTKKVRFQQTLIDGEGDTLMVDVPTREGVGEIPFFVAKGESSQAIQCFNIYLGLPIEYSLLNNKAYELEMTEL